MHPLKITIPGEFWDSFIYSGRLYLFRLDGSVITLDWDRIIDGWRIEDPLRVSFECAFRQGDFLYGPKFARLFKDSEVRALLRNKFDRLAERQFELTLVGGEQFVLRQQQSPFPFPHTDLTIYKNTFFVTSKDGVYQSSCNKKNKYPVGIRVERNWDGPAYSVAASYNNLAVAAGDEGLFEIPLPDKWEISRGREPTNIVNRNCTDCHWAFYSIYCSSHTASGYLASFKKEPVEPGDRPYRRLFDRLISSEQIFGSNGRGYSWGNQDKLCYATDHRIDIVRYRPWAEDHVIVEAGILDMEDAEGGRTIELQPWKGGVVAGGVAIFGTIVECTNAIVVIPSDGPPITLPGEPTNWRIFPRSVQYENHLHVAYEDRIEILSFNHDYFVDQDMKRSGINGTYLGFRSEGSQPRRRYVGRTSTDWEESL